MNDTLQYRARIPGKRRQIELRGVPYAVTEWGEPDAPLLFYLHGWGDTGSSFQFVVDAMGPGWRVVAPDWRGFGRTSASVTSYWFPDYVADLHELLEAYSPDEPVRLVGHSMGGNVGGLYAGTLPERVAAFVNVEGFGLPDADPDEAPQRLRRWVEAARTPQAFSRYPDFAAFATKLRQRNPGMSEAQAAFIARQWGRESAQGDVELWADPLHRLPNPILYRRAEAEACWRRITARMLLITGSRSEFAARFATTTGSAWTDVPREVIADAGHMPHFEAPEALAARIVAFFEAAL